MLRRLAFVLPVLLLLIRVAAAQPAQDTTLTDAEREVQRLIQTDGIHVVHFWAPWCGNSLSEMRKGWSDLVEANPEVTFTFVTVWNNGLSGREKMDAHSLPARVVELTLPDYGSSRVRAQRRKSFLGLPLTWVPSTWIFHKNGELAFALNYGEMEMETLQSLISTARP